MAIFLQQTSKCPKCHRKFRHFGFGTKGVKILIDFVIISLCKKCGEQVHEFIYGKMATK